MTRQLHTLPRIAQASGALLILFVLVGCGASTTTTTPDASRAAAVASEWGLQGTGDETTENMELAAGAATVSCTYSGSKEFGLAIIDASGATVEDLRSPAGSGCVGMSYNLAQSGSYTLRISADGPWEMTVTSEGEQGVSESR